MKHLLYTLILFFLFVGCRGNYWLCESYNLQPAMVGAGGKSISFLGDGAVCGLLSDHLVLGGLSAMGKGKDQIC